MIIRVKAHVVFWSKYYCQKIKQDVITECLRLEFDNMNKSKEYFKNGKQRNPHTTFQQHKVLPERGINKKLRATNNGVILHSGGTLSGRHHQKTLSLERENKSFKIFRTNSISSNPSDREHEDKLPTRSYIPHHGASNRYTTRYESKKPYKEQIPKFGSEPDLRNSNMINHQDNRDKFRGKKKYKAPAPPNLSVSENLHAQNYEWNEDTTEPLIRRSRLFKTRSELKKRCSSPVNQSLELAKTAYDPKRNISDKTNLSNIELRNRSRKPDYSVNRLSLPEMTQCHSIPEFQSELKEVVQRIKSTKRDLPEIDRLSSNKYIKNTQEKEKLKTLDHNINKKENVRNKLKNLELETVNEKDNVLNNLDHDRGQPSGKESTPEKQSQNSDNQKKIQPNKLYYFGMKEPIQENLNKSYSDTTPLNNYNHIFTVPNSSGSDLSSELEMDESNISTNGIALQLRPILPKKQLEIPRFSPAAAWKQLSAVESNFAASTITSEDPPIFMEDRIEKLSRPPPPPALQTGPRSSYDKSGDSGISGDAGPVGFEDSPEIVTDARDNIQQLPMVVNRSSGMSWTPQQDLGEDESSTDEELQNQVLRSAPVKFTPKPNVFSLSLPRDNQLSSYISRNFVNKRDTGLSNSFRFQGGNWFLSKSAPNSLNGLNSLELPNSQKLEDINQTNETIINNTQNVSRVMYLPESETMYRKNPERLKIKDIGKEKCNAVDYKLSLSKSCENILAQVQSSPEPEDLQDPPHINDMLKMHKPKRFSFQSTIRQIERKRLAERLSKEAEKKEKQRLSELAAMQRVEEEFQKKRAREKASIRQQLRLFSLDDSTWSNIPSNVVKDNVPARSDPDGAVSSTTSSPMEKRNSHHVREEYLETSKKQQVDLQDDVKKTQMTQILSEYRQPQREYKDFRGSPRYMGDFTDGHYTKQTTIHPQVTCNMPKASSHQSETETSNYRKQFAHGVKTNKSGESTYSDDSQPNNRNYSPKIYRNNRTSISRF
ncbi:hypothetical protein RN001_015694 [Aquatica leii]|uniref:Uncharacterized protein n=1 Tax=Aquatica leii TaxID=1421715 RepID=A0AAN7NTL2_9COLE|nr:hypothetical protein RN001_015694 [Aquatica leii]